MSDIKIPQHIVTSVVVVAVLVFAVFLVSRITDPEYIKQRAAENSELAAQRLEAAKARAEVEAAKPLEVRTIEAQNAEMSIGEGAALLGAGYLAATLVKSMFSY